MPANDFLLDAANRLLPGVLSRSVSGVTEELELRFFETSEILVHSLALDPDAPYYLALLVISGILDDLRGIENQVATILETLAASRKEAPLPRVDRHFDLAANALANISTKVARGGFPTAHDLELYSTESRLFAAGQLVPQETVLSDELYRIKLLGAIKAMNETLGSIHERAARVTPGSFFVDTLDASIPKSRQLDIFLSRVQGMVESQRLTLSDPSSEVRASASSKMLAETATMITLINTLVTLRFLAGRARVTGQAIPVTTLNGTLVSPGVPAHLDGTVETGDLDNLGTPRVHIDPDDDTLVLDIDQDGLGNPGIAGQVIVLPSSTGPLLQILDKPGTGWVTEHDFTVVFLLQIHKDGVLTPLHHRFVVIPSYDVPGSLPVTAVDGDYAYVVTPVQYYKRVTGVWTAIGTTAPTITRLEYKGFFDDSRRTLTTTNHAPTGLVLSDVVDTTDAMSPDRLEFTMKSVVTWRERGSDITIQLQTIGTDQTSYAGSPSVAQGLGPLIDSEIDGAFVGSPGNQFTTGSGDFTLVRPGHVLRVLTGTNPGDYRVTAVPSASLLEFDGSIAAETGLTYEIVTVSGSNLLVAVGTSPTLPDIVDAINLGYGTVVLAEQRPGRRIRISSLISGVSISGSTAMGSRLRVLSQPAGSVVPTLLGLSVDPVYGRCTALLDRQHDLVAAGILIGMMVELGATILETGGDETLVSRVLGSNSFAPLRKILSIPSAVEYRLLALGAKGYQDTIEPVAGALKAAIEVLPLDTEALSVLLGKSVNSPGDVRRSRDYLVDKFGNPADPLDPGPVSVLIREFSKYQAPVSRSLESAIAGMRERGFDQSVDKLLTGDVEGALDEANAAYGLSLKRSFQSLGVTL